MSKTLTTHYEPLDLKTVSYVEDTSDRATYNAQCHCGAVKYTVTLKHPFPKYPVNVCTCSICTHNGYLNVYPAREDVVWKQGYDNMSSYSFNTKTMSHYLCKTCGSSIMIDFRRYEQGAEPKKDLMAMNVRNFQDVDLEKLSYTHFDGKNLLPDVTKEAK